MITQPIISRYYVSELIAYLKNVVTLCNNNNANNVLKISTWVTIVEQKNTAIETVFALQKDSPETKELETLDMRRDTAFIGIKTTATGLAYHFNAVKSAAANTILDCIAKYGKGVQDYNYMAESEVLDKLVIDFEGDAAVTAALATLSINDWAAELKTANTQFKAKYIVRNNQLASKPSQSATELRAEVIAAYKKLTQKIFSLADLDETNSYVTLIGQLNTLSDKYNDTVKKRSSNKETSNPAPPVNPA